MSAGQLARQRSSSSGTRPAVRSGTPVEPRNLEFEFEPCAATASIFLYSQDTTIICLHHDTLAIERRFERHKERILFLSVDNVSERGAGRLVVSYDAGQTAIVWDLFTGDEIARFASYEPIRVAAWMKNGNVAFGNSQGNVILFEPSTSEHISARTIFDPITSLAPASDCQTYAIGYLNGSILIVALQPAFTILHTLTTSRAPSPIVNLAWHASSTKQKSDMLATQTSDGDLRVWSVSKPPTAESPKTIRILKRSDNVESGLNWLAWSKNGRILQYSDGETWIWDVRTKHISCEPIPTVDGVRALANYGQGATLFTLGPNHTVQQYDVSHPALVKRVQYLPMLPPPVPAKANHGLPESGNHSIPGTAPPMPLSHGSDSGPGPVTLSTIQRSANEMLSVENVRRKRSDISSPVSASSRSRTESVSSISTNPRYQKTNPSISSQAASGTTFSTISPSMVGRDSLFSGGSSIFPPTQTASRASSGRRSKGSRLRQEVLRSPELSKYVDLFPRTRARLSTVTYKQPQTLDQEGLGPDELRRQMLDVVFGWGNDIEPLIKDELSHHEPGSTSAVLLSKWLGEVDTDVMTAAMNSGSINSSDWMLLALSSMGGQGSMGKMGQAFVQKLLQQGDFHTSATVLLGLGDREDAVEVYVSRSFYMEAILLTCLLFPGDWQRQAHLVRRWGEFVVENSQQQLAIRCFSCTGMDPPLPWASPSLRSESTISQTTPSISSVISPPLSPPPPTATSAGSVRMTTKNSSLKVITSFGAPEKAQFKFPGLKSDDRTPTNAPGITPIAESAISPAGTPDGYTRLHSRSKANLTMRTATPGGYHKSRLPSIGETPIDVTMPVFPRPSALPTPDNSGSEFERESKFESADENTVTNDKAEPPLLLSSARYDPGSEASVTSPLTALPGATFPVNVLPDPSSDTFTALAEKSRARNGSRDRKPDGLQIQMPSQTHIQHDYLSSGGTGSGQDRRQPGGLSGGSLPGRFDNRSERSHSTGGQSWTPGKSPSASSRSIDQYISSLEEAGYHTRRHKGSSRRRQGSREGRSQPGEHKPRSKHRGHDRSEDRGRNRKYIRPAKRSPSSPVPMSPDDLHLYQDNPSTESLNAQLAGPPSDGLESRHGRDHSVQSDGIFKLRSGSKASDYSNRTVLRRRSPEGFPDSHLGSEASFNSRSMMSSRPDSPNGSLDPRGRSKSKSHSTAARSPSSPLPMSPQLKYYQRSEDEDDPLRFVDANRQRIRSRHRSSSRKPRERGTSSRRDKSPDRRRVQQNKSVGPATSHDGLQAPHSAVEPRSTANEHFADTVDWLVRNSGSSDITQKKLLAARELEARRESLARRPLAPQIPHPADLSNSRPPLGARSQTDLGDSPVSWSNVTALSHQQAPRPPITPPITEMSEYGNRAGAASVGPYGLPATPRAMRHPRADASPKQSNIPAVPELPETLQSPPDAFYTDPLSELRRSMSAPIPEQPAVQVPSELPPHPAFHKGLRTGSKRSNFSPLGDIGQHRHRPSGDSHPAALLPSTMGIEETMQAADSTVQSVTAEQPPLLPELQHLSIPPPPPPPPALPKDASAHHSASSGSGVGVINIAIDDQPRQQDSHIVDVPSLPRLNTLSPPPGAERGSPSTVTRSNSNHRRGRSENFMNNIKGITDRLRSTSRGRSNAKSPLAETGKAPSPYESVPPLYF